MGPTKQRIAIAEACGWTCILDDPERPAIGRLIGRHGGREYEALPNYPNDLNAMHEAVSLLPEEDKHAYAVILADMLWLPTNWGWQDWRDTLSISEATTTQRAEAFLRTIGKWEDGE